MTFRAYELLNPGQAPHLATVFFDLILVGRIVRARLPSQFFSLQGPAGELLRGELLKVR